MNLDDDEAVEVFVHGHDADPLQGVRQDHQSCSSS